MHSTTTGNMFYTYVKKKKNSGSLHWKIYTSTTIPRNGLITHAFPTMRFAYRKVENYSLQIQSSGCVPLLYLLHESFHHFGLPTGSFPAGSIIPFSCLEIIIQGSERVSENTPAQVLGISGYYDIIDDYKNIYIFNNN